MYRQVVRFHHGNLSSPDGNEPGVGLSPLFTQHSSYLTYGRVWVGWRRQQFYRAHPQLQNIKKAFVELIIINILNVDMCVFD